MRLLALLAAGLFAGSLLADDDKKPDDKKAEKVDNQEYKTWSKFKAGSMVVMKITAEADGVTTEATVTVKLVEVKDDKLVLEIEGAIKVNGMEFKEPTAKRDVPKQLDKSPEWYDPKSDKPKGTTEEGKKKIKVGDTEYECKWYKTKNKLKLPTGDVEVEGEYWISEDVPSGLVKTVAKSKAFSETVEATGITIKK